MAFAKWLCLDGFGWVSVLVVVLVLVAVVLVLVAVVLVLVSVLVVVVVVVVAGSSSSSCIIIISSRLVLLVEIVVILAKKMKCISLAPTAVIYNSVLAPTAMVAQCFSWKKSVRRHWAGETTCVHLVTRGPFFDQKKTASPALGR